MIAEHVAKLACPNCAGAIALVPAVSGSEGLLCPVCELVFPIIDDIPVLLPNEARNHGLELPLVRKLAQAQCGAASERFSQAVERTLRLLTEKTSGKSWEWEDEEFWSREYAAEAKRTPKAWNDRLWMRDQIVSAVLEPGAFRSKTIVDVGCGEGQSFRGILSRYCDDHSLYIAIDISLPALQLNRTRNPRPGSLFILGSASALPLKENTADALCYWGILHHTALKAATLKAHMRYVREGGVIFLHEALVRPAALPAALRPRVEESAHEERIRLEDIMQAVHTRSDLTIAASRELQTSFYTGVLRLFSGPLLKRKKLLELLLSVDRLLMRTLGRWVPFLRPGEILMVLRKTSALPGS